MIQAHLTPAATTIVIIFYMMSRPLRISIKLKLLVLLLSLSILVLVTFATMVLRVVINDKVAYAYDNILLNSRSIANLIRAESDAGLIKIQSIMDYYSSSERKFAREGEGFFNTDSKWLRILVFQQEEGQAWKLAAKLEKNSLTSQGILSDSNLATNLAKIASESGIAIRALAGTETWALAVRIKAKEAQQGLVAIAEYDGGSFLDIFYKPQVQDTFLISESDILLNPQESAHSIKAADIQNVISTLPRGKDQRSGVLKSSKNDLLVSFADVGFANLKVISIIPKSSALQAAQIIQNQSIYFLLGLAGLVLIVSVLGANGLTSNLKRLQAATNQISAGNLDVVLQTRGTDEISDVSRGFNKMAKEIKRLVSETAEKARMAEELKTASLVQSTLFPNSIHNTDHVQLRGFYQPASECGGDWWNYAEIDSKIFVVVCDVTGHGVPAALLTSAARSAFSVIVDRPDMTPDRCLTELNHAIFETTQGKLQMTATVACLDKISGRLEVAVASHEPPFLLRKGPLPLDRKDVEYLLVPPGHRLGESNSATYSSLSVNLESGDVLFFCTDGLTEQTNAKGKDLGTRKVIQTLVKSFNDGADIDKIYRAVEDLAKEHRGDIPLADDLTFVILKRV